MSIKQKLWLATHNKGKIKEFQTLLKDMPFDLKGICSTLKAPEETGSTFEENAFIKLKAFQKHKPFSWILAEDSGIEVQALNGRPGIHSSRYRGENSNWMDKLEGLLEEMQKVPAHQRQAQMVSLVLVSTPEGRVLKSRGVIQGFISDQIQGEKGFAYDFIFIPKKEKQTLAELGMDYKNKYSHRAQAVQQFKTTASSLVKPLNSSSIR